MYYDKKSTTLCHPECDGGSLPPEAEAAFPPWGSVSTRPRCGACHSAMVIDYWVYPELWDAVVHPSLRDAILCIDCFASRADEKMLDWTTGVQWLLPISLALTHALPSQPIRCSPASSAAPNEELRFYPVDGRRKERL